VNTALVAIILFFTVTFSMTLGVALGYGLFVSILHVFSRPEGEPQPELVHHQASSGGD
jgi:hypothetical protein